MAKLASENSTWLKEYQKKNQKVREKSNGNKIIIPIMLLLMAGGLDGYLISQGGLNDPQQATVIKAVAIIGGVLLVMSILLITLGKKRKVAGPTTECLDNLLTTEEEVKEFDAQMAQDPVFLVKEDANISFFATKDYLGQKYSALGDETYMFARLRDVASMHVVGRIPTRGVNRTGILGRTYLIEFHDRNGKVLMSGSMGSHSHLESLKEELKKVIPTLMSTGL